MCIRDSSRVEIAIVTIFTQQAKRRMIRNLRRVDANEDQEVNKIVDSLAENKGYRWDTL